MLSISSDQVRQLLAMEYPDGPRLLALVQQLAANAQSDFIMPREHFHQIYAVRLKVSHEVTHHYTEGLSKAVIALAQSDDTQVRLVGSSLTEGSCTIFANPVLSKVIGVMFHSTIE